MPKDPETRWIEQCCAFPLHDVVIPLSLNGDYGATGIVRELSEEWSHNTTTEERETTTQSWLGVILKNGLRCGHLL